MGDSGRVILRADRSCGAKPLKHTPLFSGAFPVRHRSWANPAGQGADCAWMRRRFLALSSNSRTILKRKFAIGPDSRSGLIMGEFVLGPASPCGRSKPG